MTFYIIDLQDIMLRFEFREMNALYTRLAVVGIADEAVERSDLLNLR